jgi:plasmid maintenance system killer protein
VELGFGSQHEADTYSDVQHLRRVYGDITGQKIWLRLSQIDAAANLARLSRLPQVRCRQLASDHRGHYSLAIDELRRLIVAVAHEPVPCRSDGTIELEQVTRLKFIALKERAPRDKEGA